MRFTFLMLIIFPFAAMADTLSLDDALRATYTACIGIDDELTDLKKMAGINTAITGVGTAAGVGATVVGIVKTSTDKKAEELENILREIDELQLTPKELTEQEFEQFMSEFNQVYDTNIASKESVKAELEKTVAKSKSLGNWRTGLVAGATATNIAGAIIAKGNRVDDDLHAQINNCKESVRQLRAATMQARISGLDVGEAEAIANACGEFDYVDLSKIDTKAKGAMISSGIGVATGVGGVITSFAANTDKTRGDNSESGKSKEKNLNNAANILSGATALASGAATVFNATQINAIKKVASVAEKCTGVLK